MSRGSAADLVGALRDHHARIEQMMTAVVAASGHDRTVLFRRLRRFLAAHEAAEEVFLHANVNSVSGETDVAEQRLQEESDAARSVAALEGIDVDSAEFGAVFAELLSSVRRHARAEELRELPEVLERCAQADIEAMRQALDHVDVIVVRRNGPLGEETRSFDMMLESARAEFRSLRSELTV